MPEPTVQVPVSQPTREQIAARLRGEIFDAVPDDNDMQHVLSLAADLLLQPTPTAEPCERCGGTGYQGDGPFSMGVPCPACTAEPPRIEDMAPGTHAYIDGRFGDDGVCHAHTPGQTNYSAWPDRCYRPRTDRVHIDRSTIRDVTPPKGDDRV